MAARRVLSGRPGVRVSAPREWTAASVPPVADSIIAVHVPPRLHIGAPRCRSRRWWSVFARSTAASGFANAVDSCHARGLHARSAGDETSLTLEAFSDSGDSLTTPIFQCVLGKLGTRAAARERMYATRAIDGTQSEEWGSYKATWTYEPDRD